MMETPRTIAGRGWCGNAMKATFAHCHRRLRLGIRYNYAGHRMEGLIFCCGPMTLSLWMKSAGPRAACLPPLRWACISHGSHPEMLPAPGPPNAWDWRWRCPNKPTCGGLGVDVVDGWHRLAQTLIAPDGSTSPLTNRAKVNLTTPGQWRIATKAANGRTHEAVILALEPWKIRRPRVGGAPRALPSPPRCLCTYRQRPRSSRWPGTLWGGFWRSGLPHELPYRRVRRLCHLGADSAQRAFGADASAKRPSIAGLTGCAIPVTKVPQGKEPCVGSEYLGRSYGQDIL